MKRLYQIIKWLILIGAYAYLAYKIITYDNYEALWEQLKTYDLSSLLWVGGILLLLPLNLLFESRKWQLLTQNFFPQSLINAFKNVLKGQLGAFFTPNRIGEYPTRVLDFPQEKQLLGIAMGFWGSLTQTFVIGAIGCCSALFYLNKNEVIINQGWICVILALIIGLMLMLIFASKVSSLIIKHGFFKKLDQLWNELYLSTPKVNLNLVLISFLRYAVFSTQFFFALQACQANLTLSAAIIAIPTIYLCVTFTPSISISEPAVRGSYAIAILASFTPFYVNASFAAILIWVINNLFPMFTGSFMLKTQK